MSLFNGASNANHRDYANNGRFSQSTVHTIAIWVFPLATPIAQWGFACRGLGTLSGEFTLGTPASGTFNVDRASFTTGSLITLPDTTQWTNNRWHHMCQTWDGTNFRLYVDGRQRQSSTPGGTWTQSASTDIRLWARTDGTIGTTNCYLEQFGWWRTVFSPMEVDALARGVDFTRIRRDDAIILDPLLDPSQRELVAGLGTNTGTISITERAPTNRARPNLPLSRPFTTSGATRARYAAQATAALGLSGWEIGTGVRSNPGARVWPTVDPPPALLQALGASGWEPLGPRTRSAEGMPGQNVDGMPALAAVQLGATGWEQPGPTSASARPRPAPNPDPQPAWLYPGGAEPASPVTVSPRGKVGVNYDGPLRAFLMPGGWEPPASITISQRGRIGVSFDGARLLAALGVSGWEPAAPRTVNQRGRGAVSFDGPFIPFLYPGGWEPASPTIVSPRGRGGASFDASLLYATLGASGWEPGAPPSRHRRAPWAAPDVPLPPFAVALLATGWEPPAPRTQAPRGAPGPNQDGWVPFPLRSSGFEPLAPWTASPRGKMGVNFGPLSAPSVVLGATGWEPAGPVTINQRGKLASWWDGPLVPFPLRAGGWEPASPVTVSPRPGIVVSHDPFLTVITVLGPVGWEPASPRTTNRRGAAGQSADAGILAPPRLVTGWEPGSPIVRPPPRPPQGQNYDGLLLALLGRTGWESQAPAPRAPRRPQGQIVIPLPAAQVLLPTGWEPGAGIIKQLPRAWVEFFAGAGSAIVVPQTLYAFIYGPPSVALTAASRAIAPVVASRSAQQTDDSATDPATEKSRTIVVLSS